MAEAGGAEPSGQPGVAAAKLCRHCLDGVSVGVPVPGVGGEAVVADRGERPTGVEVGTAALHPAGVEAAGDLLAGQSEPTRAPVAAWSVWLASTIQPPADQWVYDGDDPRRHPLSMSDLGPDLDAWLDDPEPARQTLRLPATVRQAVGDYLAEAPVRADGRVGESDYQFGNHDLGQLRIWLRARLSR